MQNKYTKLKAEKRKILGRKVKNLRKLGILPANLYGAKIKSQTLQLGQKDFAVCYKQSGETGIVELTIGENTYPVLIKNIARQPVIGTFLHVDFRQIDLKEKLLAQIPLELTGEAPGVAVGGVLVQLLNEVEVEALPTDLPENIKVDVSGLKEIGQSFTVADLIFDKTKIVVKNDPKALVVKIEAPAKEEVVVKPVATAEEAKPGEEKAKEGGKEAAKPEEKKEEKKAPSVGEKPKEEKK